MCSRRLLMVLLVLCGCGGGEPGVEVTTIPTVTTVAEPTTGVSTTTTLPGPSTTRAVITTMPPTTTTTSRTSFTGVGYYRYGADGLYRVTKGAETRLVDEAVDRVWDDHLGGVLFRLTSRGTYFWLRSGEPEAIALSELDPDNPWLEQSEDVFTGLADDRPTLFYAGVAGPVDAPHPCGGDWQLVGRDLQTNRERGLMCLPIEDGWFGIRSIGGGLFVGDFGVASGSCGTSRELRFWDTEGREVSVAANPFPDSCEPCELSAVISADGALLAYRFRADSKWPPQQWDGVDTDQWWEQSKTVPADLVVTDLETGDEQWRIEVAAWVGLADFDGRYLVASTVGYRAEGPVESTIYNTWGGQAPVTVPGLVTLVRSP